MVAIRREEEEEYLVAPDLVGEVAVLTGCLPELNTRSFHSPVRLCICASECMCHLKNPVAVSWNLTKCGRVSSSF